MTVWALRLIKRKFYCHYSGFRIYSVSIEFIMTNPYMVAVNLYKNSLISTCGSKPEEQISKCWQIADLSVLKKS